MIDIDKSMQTQKITCIKRILDPNNITVLNEIYQQRLNKGCALLFECELSENDILNHFRKIAFLQTYY